MDTTAKRDPPVSLDTSPDRYHHWNLTFAGPVATLSMDVQEDAGLSPGYRLKLNSYDLGVDIELADALQRLRFEHPEVRAVVITSLKERIFCAGANTFTNLWFSFSLDLHGNEISTNAAAYFGNGLKGRAQEEKWTDHQVVAATGNRSI